MKHSDSDFIQKVIRDVADKVLKERFREQEMVDKVKTDEPLQLYGMNRAGDTRFIEPDFMRKEIVISEINWVLSSLYDRVMMEMYNALNYAVDDTIMTDYVRYDRSQVWCGRGMLNDILWPLGIYDSQTRDAFLAKKGLQWHDTDRWFLTIENGRRIRVAPYTHKDRIVLASPDAVRIVYNELSEKAQKALQKDYGMEHRPEFLDFVYFSAYANDKGEDVMEVRSRFAIEVKHDSFEVVTPEAFGRYLMEPEGIRC